ncbi:hypothetical protein K491DRAFT_699595 [Lophiostoma macrostomum CBS 122681]|uniref:C2H2-type domain-containing protein n=1 Tax=Lophiostoma macrostomum CBS 122681 TaxID=1314788 RepID=A0A6A6SJC4_9PLEO|nr:hypothetical protein K491DRAFT_699595 [Lophiostoma macrostomum CBS 122681]
MAQARFPDVDPSLGAAPFERALANFKMGLKRRDLEAFKKTTLTNLKTTIGELQEKQHASRRLQGLNRLQPFLEAMDQFGKAISILANTNEFIAFVWGPVKLLLSIASTFVDAFKELLSVYQQIGEHLPNIMRYEELFRHNAGVREALVLLYGDILLFHQAALKYFQASLWKQIFKATWKDYKSKFGEMISDMSRHYKLVESTATVEQIADLQRSREIENQHRESASKDEHLRKLYMVTQWLRPASVEGDHMTHMKKRVPSKATGMWLFDDPTFQEWFDLQFPMVPPLLWLCGIPGAGKTVLASLVIEKALELLPTPTVVYFYCRHKDPERDNFRAIARTILSQLLTQDRDLLAYFYRKCCESGEPVLESRSTIESLLKEAFENCKCAYIVIDGLDECSREDRKDIAQWFRALIEDLPTSEPDRLRCLFVSQDDGFARKDLSGLAKIKIEIEDNKTDIESYCISQAEKLTLPPYHLARERASAIAKIVTDSISGMFLLATLIWHEILGQTSIAGLEEELEPDVFPKEVSIAYDRILTRIQATVSESRWDEVRLILGWLVVAKRPLKWHEIQCLKAINFVKGTIEYERERFIIGPTDLLDSLVDEREDGTVQLVHLSAKYFLVDDERIDVAAEELKMATLCLDYINMSALTSPTATAANSGHYGFVEYAMLYWVRHIEAGLAGHQAHQSCLEDLAETVDNFLQQHWHEPDQPLAISQRNRDKFAWFENHAYFEQFLQAVVSTRKQITFFGKMKQGEIALDSSEVISRVRETIENTYESGPRVLRDDLEIKYGANLFKCPRFSCQSFTSGFSSRTDRDRHIDKHDRPFRCTETACTGYVFGFATVSDLDKHMRETHSTVRDNIQFPTDEDVQNSMLPNTVDPQSAVTSDPTIDNEATIEITPESVSRLDTQLEAGPGIQPEPIFHPLPAPQRTRRRGRQREFTCSHCGKMFRKKYNWTSHLLTHSTEKPFKCSQCEKAFSRATDLRRHGGSHGEKMYVCFGQLEGGGTWGCGRSFARADILSGHHKTKVGQLCIKELLIERSRGGTEGLGATIS